MVNKELKVKNMNCSSCEMLIKDILQDENVDVISINYKTGDLKISYNETNIDFEKIKIILAEEGYPVIN